MKIFVSTVNITPVADFAYYYFVLFVVDYENHANVANP